MPGEPFCLGLKSIKLELDPGTYFWCGCGKTSHSPFCDGSHKGTGFQPLKFEVTDKGRFSLCQCKATKNPPFCDNSHRDP